MKLTQITKVYHNKNNVIHALKDINLMIPNYGKQDAEVDQHGAQE